MMQDVHVKLNTGFSRQKQPLTKKKSLFTSKLDLNIRKKLVKCYIWNTALHMVKNLTLRKVDQKYLKSLDMWCWRMMEKMLDRSCEI